MSSALRQPTPAPTTPNPTVFRGQRRERTVDTRPADVDQIAPSPTVCGRDDVLIGARDRMIAGKTFVRPADVIPAPAENTHRVGGGTSIGLNSRKRKM